MLPPCGVDVVGFFNWIACAAVVQMFPIVSDNFGIYYNFAFYTVVSIVAEILIKFFLIETKGLSK